MGGGWKRGLVSTGYLVSRLPNDLDEEDKSANEQALQTGARLLSAYTLCDGTTRIWIIKEADRSASTLLLPADY